jgi:import receptor subunit TOM22
MVELVEVPDESFESGQAGPEENDDEYYTDTGTRTLNYL